jgi:hypothetical protein
MVPRRAVAVAVLVVVGIGGAGVGCAKKQAAPDAPVGWAYVFHSPEGDATAACTHVLYPICGWTPEGTPGISVWDFYLSGSELVRCGSAKDVGTFQENGYVMPLDPNGKGRLLLSDPQEPNTVSQACAAGPNDGYYQLVSGKAILGDLATNLRTAVLATDVDASAKQLSVDDAGRAYWLDATGNPAVTPTIRSYDPGTKALDHFDPAADFGLPKDGSILSMTAGEAGKLYFVTKSGDILVVDVATKHVTDLQKTGVTLVSHQMGQPVFVARASSNPDDVASSVGPLSTITAVGAEKALLDLQPLFGIGHGFGTNVEAIRVQAGKLYLGTGHGVYRSLDSLL